MYDSPDPDTEKMGSVHKEVTEMTKWTGLAAMALLLAFVLTGCKKGFTDVPDDAWYANAVEYVKTEGLMSGTSEDTFEPNRPLTRAMLATVLYRKAGTPELAEGSRDNPFEDVPVDSWYADAIYWARANGIVSGVDATHFLPDKIVNREQTALMLWRYEGLPEVTELATCSDRLTVSPYAIMGVSWAWNSHVMKGSKGVFDPFGSTTRAQIAQILFNQR